MTLVEVLNQLGDPDSRGTLRALLGSGWRPALASDQAIGTSCAYYLSSADRSGRAFQLCFNSAQNLVEKAVISTSGMG